MTLEDQIDEVSREIRAALWQVPADMDRAKLLISKRMGLRICLGTVQVKLKAPIVRVVDSEREAA